MIPLLLLLTITLRPDPIVSHIDPITISHAKVGDFVHSDESHFRHLFHCSATLSALLAVGWIATIVYIRKIRPVAKTERRECSDRERRIMVMIHRRVVEQKDYLHPDLTLASLSCKLGVNTSYISRAVNNSTGRHFSRWVNEIRITEAIARLSDPARDSNFSEIAYDVGFNDRTTFFRAFKQITGTSPREFCRSIEKKCCNS